MEWEYQRQLPANGVRYLMGVTGISDEIVIKTKVSSDAVRSDIEAAFKHRAQKDSRQISVAVDGHEVTLGSCVHSRSEKDVAAHFAWEHPVWATSSTT